MTFDLTALKETLKAGACRLRSLPPSAQAVLGEALYKENKQPQLWVMDQSASGGTGFQALEKLADCFHTLNPERPIHILPPDNPADMASQGDRLLALSALQNGNASCVITLFQCLEETFPKVGNSTLLKTGSDCPPDELFQTLEKQGYTLDVEVYEKGRAARRGGIIDLWLPTHALPVRIEFFGNEVDSIRSFDAASQRSIKKLEQIEIMPLNAQGEVALDELLPDNTLQIFSNVNVEATPPSPQKCDEGGASTIEIGCITSDVTDIDLAPYNTNLKPVSELHRADRAEQQRKLFFQTLEKMVSKGWNIDICMETPGTAERLKEVYLSEVRGQRSEVRGQESEVRDQRSEIRVRIGLLHGSFVCEKQKHLLITEADIYGYQPKTAHVRRRDKAVETSGKRVADFSDIQPGELVVHADHGIGKYMGLMEIEMSGKRQEMLLLEYAEGARLYLPTGQAHLMTRYTGIGNKAPKLHSLKGRRWQNERISAQDAIEDLAARLLETQAKRAIKKGRTCGPDTHMQSEFENAFPYMETPDQLKAIDDVKDDLISKRPMDRLICGDAGYGKTEVAMRAAFKMVMEGRQVAILVPTTILAQQHFDTFTERMAAFPVAVEMLSRFRTRAEQNETVKRLQSGDTHIVIGTHRLVSSDVQFNDLGLVVIDEEQRFGVRAKEHLKKLREQVDVLTMTATPIPRTLYMSLTGTREMSTIQTPPQERQPIETIVLQWHEDIIREAVLHELARGGQVFYLHNRVQTIGKVCEDLTKLIPEARIEYAHGQMSEKQLSDIMHRFVQGRFDVLLSTTIIESGVDIPRANTIFVDRADRFGLSDLYQLRGRVGRARQKAFAFLLLPEHGALSDQARQRIEALKQFGGLGAGFRIAMRDLEIRGAGNLLGAQQSGHIAAIGFDLYCQLLKRSIARLQGKKVPPLIDASIELDFIDRSPAGDESENAAYIPYNYVDDENLRVKLYGRIASLATETEVRLLKKEFADRFGAPPPAVRNLFDIARIRIAAAHATVQSIRVHKERIILTRNREPLMVEGKYPRLSRATTTARLREILSTLRSLK